MVIQLFENKRFPIGFKTIHSDLHTFTSLWTQQLYTIHNTIQHNSFSYQQTQQAKKGLKDYPQNSNPKILMFVHRFDLFSWTLQSIKFWEDCRWKCICFLYSIICGIYMTFWEWVEEIFSRLLGKIIWEFIYIFLLKKSKLGVIRIIVAK